MGNFDDHEPTWLERYLFEQLRWSRITFGSGKRTIGITKHIAKECDEIRAKPDDVEEWIDIIILALDGYWRAGGTPEMIQWDLRAKQDKNFGCAWPPPQPEDEATEHVR